MTTTEAEQNFFVYDADVQPKNTLPPSKNNNDIKGVEKTSKPTRRGKKCQADFASVGRIYFASTNSWY